MTSVTLACSWRGMHGYRELELFRIRVKRRLRLGEHDRCGFRPSACACPELAITIALSHQHHNLTVCRSCRSSRIPLIGISERGQVKLQDAAPERKGHATAQLESSIAPASQSYYTKEHLCDILFTCRAHQIKLLSLPNLWSLLSNL